MKVENVLRYLRKNALPIQQYKIGKETAHFFKCTDISKRIGSGQFRIMECDVVQYLVKI